MVADITAKVNRLIKESRKNLPDTPKKEGGPFFTCKSIDKEDQRTVFKSMCPYVGVKL